MQILCAIVRLSAELLADTNSGVSSTYLLLWPLALHLTAMLLFKNIKELLVILLL